METKPIGLLICFLTAILSGACSVPVQTVEVTRIVPQTIVVTQVVTQSEKASVTASPSILATQGSFTLTPQITQGINSTLLEGGGIVIVQYYTFLGLGLYDKAYQLFSAKHNSQTSLDYYTEGAKSAFKVVKVLQVEQFNEWVKQLGGNPTPVPVSDNWYYVKIYAEGENGMSGSQLNGIQELFIYVTQENGEWKIDQFATAVVP